MPTVSKVLEVAWFKAAEAGGTGASATQGASGATSYSLAGGNASRTFHHCTAWGAGLPLYYQSRDYAALQRRPPGFPPHLDSGVRGSATQGASGATS